MQKSNVFLFIFFLLAFIAESNAQLTATFTRSPAQTAVSLSDYAVCPLTNIVYQINNYTSTCHDVTVVNGDIVSITGTGAITISWRDSTNCKIVVTRKNETACTSGSNPAALSKDFTPIVLSLAGTTPAIVQSPSGQLSVGFEIPLLYRGVAKYPKIGALDTGAIFVLDEYRWTFPSAWSLDSPVDKTDLDTIRYTTDVGTGGNITAKTYNKVCPVLGFSPVRVLPINRVMPSPCPIIGDNLIEFCGQSIPDSKFDCSLPPTNFVAPPGGVIYEWSVTPSDGWTKIFSFKNSAAYITDGQKERVVKVKVSAYGVSSECSLTVPLYVAHPLTKVKSTFLGKKLLCNTEKFFLDSPLPNLLPSGSSATWNVSSLIPGINAPITPLSGNGTSAQLTASGIGGARSKIEFVVQGCGVSTTLADTFFAGLPALFNQRINGIPGTQAFLCPGSHYAALKVEGANSSCVTWTNSGNNPYNFNCLSADIYLTGYSGSSAFTAKATNECGTNDTRFFFSPKTFGCNAWGLNIFPNPAVDFMTVETKITENSPLQEAPNFEEVRLINGVGNLVFQSQQAGKSITIPLGGISPGIYTLQAIANGEQVSKVINIKLE